MLEETNRKQYIDASNDEKYRSKRAAIIVDYKTVSLKEH